MAATTELTASHSIDVTLIIDQLWRRDAENNPPSVFALVDGARNKRIEPLVRNSGLENDCLFEGPMTYALRRAAPHIVKLQPQAAFTRQLLSMGWGNAWGIFAIGDEALKLPQIRNRFRRIARVQGPNGKPMLFRYFDPRVMRAYLPTCNVGDVRKVFGSLSAFMMEDSDPRQMLRYTPAVHDAIKTTTILFSQHKELQGQKPC